MKLLFLRGQVPDDRPYQQILYDQWADCDDMWTLLADRIASTLKSRGEIWYWIGKNRKTKVSPQKRVFEANWITERWLLDFDKIPIGFTPDVIFARGGFPQYDPILKRFPKAFKIYYGAGKRIFPQTGFKAFNLILVDTPVQAKEVQIRALRPATLMIKPCADTIFKPMDMPKKYDVIFCANEQRIKGHDFILPLLPEGINAIQVGIVSEQMKAKYGHKIKFLGWQPRRSLPELYAQSKVAVICCESVDSCPRVIPEALACNCPILVRKSVNVWDAKYITPQTGRRASDENFVTELLDMIQNHNQFSPAKYYQENLSLEVAAKHIFNLIT